MDTISKIRVGIITDGAPQLEITDCGDSVVKNAVIGKDFHWQRIYPLILPSTAIVEVEEGWLIAEMPLEEYVASVVSSEMNPDASAEFIKAHSIISRSWAAGKVLNLHREDTDEMEILTNRIVTWQDTSDHLCYEENGKVYGFHVCNDDHCQRYQGVGYINDKVLECVRATEGMILNDKRGEVIDARFSKCCGGRSERFSTCWQNQDYDYLSPVDDPWCDLSHLAERERTAVLSTVLKDYDRDTTPDYHDWCVEITAREIEENLRHKFDRDLGAIVDLQPLARGASGRIYLLRVVGEKGELELGKELSIRKLLSPSHLLSSAFEVERIEGEELSFKLQGRGWGHGVGLCQIGAAVMAFKGCSHQEILNHYYPNSNISKI